MESKKAMQMPRDAGQAQAEAEVKVKVKARDVAKGRIKVVAPLVAGTGKTPLQTLAEGSANMPRGNETARRRFATGGVCPGASADSANPIHAG